MDAPSEDSPAFQQLANGAPLPDDRVLRALEAQLASTPSPARPRSRRVRLWLSLLSMAAALTLGSLRTLGSAAAPLVLLALCASLGLGMLLLTPAVPGHARWSHGPRQLLVLLVLLLSSIYLTWAIAEFEPLASLAHGDPRARLWACGVHGALIGGLCLVSLLWPWRRSDPFSPALLGALLGALSGVVGMLSVDAGCASREGFHVLFGHGSAVIIFGLVGAVLGRRWLAP